MVLQSFGDRAEVLQDFGASLHIAWLGLKLLDCVLEFRIGSKDSVPLFPLLGHIPNGTKLFILAEFSTNYPLFVPTTMKIGPPFGLVLTSVSLGGRQGCLFAMEDKTIKKKGVLEVAEECMEKIPWKNKCTGKGKVEEDT